MQSFPTLDVPYEDVIINKLKQIRPSGFEVQLEEIHPLLKPWQRVIVRHALKQGKYALFENTGLGKTLQYGEWAKHVARHTGGKVLIVTPLAVAHQSIRELARIDAAARYCRSQEEAENCPEQIIVVNYDMLKNMRCDWYAGVVLDESSILKNYTGKTKRFLLEAFAGTPYKLACTATAAPNDGLEYGNHAEFLDVMESTDMIQRFFINDTMQAGSYKLMGWADSTSPMGFWTWLSSWAVCISKPSDLPGFDDGDFQLPELIIHEEMVAVDHTRAFEKGELIVNGNLSATTLNREKKLTLEDRCRRAREIYDRNPNDITVIWCSLNSEADRLVELFPEFVEVRGSESYQVKEQKLHDFSDGKYPGIITKAEIAGYGLNWQHAGRHIFVGVDYSFEDFYQSIRRSYRYMRKGDVHAYLIYAESEGNVRQALQRKSDDFQKAQDRMNEAIRVHGLDRDVDHREVKIDLDEDVARGEGWTSYLGDCVLTARKHIADNSVDLSVFSPPFAELYRYTDSRFDHGNVADMDEFFEVFDYEIAELWRVTKPGRLAVVHCKHLPLYMNRDGAAGLRAFPFEIQRHFEQFRFGKDNKPSADGKTNKYRRWVLHSEVTIWKDPVIEMQRTKNHGLLWKNVTERGEVVRQGMADYLLIFRKWVDLDEMPDKQIEREMRAPKLHDGIEEHTYIGEQGPQYWDSDRDYSIQVWQKYASPVWFDINQTNVLNGALAREDRDAKHICPLQLDVIGRAIDLWSLPGEMVYSPYAGIGSEGKVAIEMHRRFVGSELKRAYWRQQVRYLKRAQEQARQGDLFTFAAQNSSSIEVPAD